MMPTTISTMFTTTGVGEVQLDPRVLGSQAVTFGVLGCRICRRQMCSCTLG